MVIREAVVDDAVEATQVLHRSITQLCSADYRNDDAILARWLQNKTPDKVAGWIARDHQQLFVIDLGNALAGFCGVTDHGEIVLNYVDPAFRLRGYSKDMMSCMEAYLQARGVNECYLESTQIAHRFYLSLGYAEYGRSPSRYGEAPGIQMRKRFRVQG